MRARGGIMRGSNSGKGFKDIFPGIEIKTLVHGEKTLMTKYRLRIGSELPSHSHPFEQIGYLIQGRLRLTIGDDTREAAGGDSWCIAPGVTHGAKVLEDSVAIEIFSPLREEYVKYENPEDIIR